MKNLSNHYISNIFQEHPICSWTLDDDFNYLSINYHSGNPVNFPIKNITDNSPLTFSVDTTSTYTNPVVYNDTVGPYGNDAGYSKFSINYIALNGTTPTKCGMILSSFTVNKDMISDMEISLLVNLKIENNSPLTATALKYGIFIAEKPGSTYDVLESKEVNISQLQYTSWYSPQMNYRIKAGTSNIYYVGFYVEFAGASQVSATNFDIYLNSYDIGKYATLGLTDGYGSNQYGSIAYAPAEIQNYFSDIFDTSIENIDFAFLPSKSYDNDSDNNGYIFIQDMSSLLKIKSGAMNHGLPITLGSESSLSLTPFSENIDDRVPNLIYPAKGFLHNKTKGSPLTAEFWMQSQINYKYFDSLDDNPGSLLEDKMLKIFGLLGKSEDGYESGIYVDKNNIYLKVGNKLASHYLGSLDRPLLVQWGYDKTSHSLFINGDEVITIDYSDDDLVTISDIDWFGFYSADTYKMNLSCFSIFPYKVNDVVAKRRFVFGQGTQAFNILTQSYSGSATTADFSKSNYYNIISYPTSYKWESGFFSNLTISNDNGLTFKNHSLPKIIFTNKSDKNSTIPTYDQYKGDMADVFIKNAETNISYFKVGFKSSDKEYSKYNAKISYGDLNSYMYYENFDILDEKVSSIIFDINLADCTDFTETILFRIKNTSGESITAWLDPTSYEISVIFNDINNNVYTIAAEQVFETNTNPRNRLLFNIDAIVDNISNIGIKNKLLTFLSNRSELSLSLLGDTDVDTFDGKVYSIGFNNLFFTKKIIDEIFGTNEDGSNFLIAINSNNNFINETIISNLTIKPLCSAQSPFFNLDVASRGYWETYIPASSFHKKMISEREDEYYESGSVQINFDADNSLYNRPSLGTYNKKSSSTEIRCITSIVNTSEYGNPLNKKDYYVEAFNVIDDADFTTDNAFDTAFYTYNNNIIHLPDNFKEGEAYLKIAFDISSHTGSTIKPIGIKYLQLASLPHKGNNFDSFEIGSRFGSPAYFISKRGTDIFYPEKINGTTDIFYNKYLYNTSNSGFSILESNNTYDDDGWSSITDESLKKITFFNNRQNGFKFNIDKLNSSILLAGISFFGNINDYYPLATNAAKEFNADNILIKLGELILKSETSELKYNIVIKKIFDVFGDNQYEYNIQRFKFMIVDDNNIESEIISFYQNGKRVINPIVSPNQWSHISIIFQNGYPALSSDSYIFISNMFSINNISFHEVGKQALDVSLVRSWNKILYNDDYTDYRDWAYWNNLEINGSPNTWLTTYLETSEGIEFLDGRRFYNSLTANNTIASENIEDDVIGLSESTDVTIYSDISWSNIVKSAL